MRSYTPNAPTNKSRTPCSRIGPAATNSVGPMSSSCRDGTAFSHANTLRPSRRAVSITVNTHLRIGCPRPTVCRTQLPPDDGVWSGAGSLVGRLSALGLRVILLTDARTPKLGERELGERVSRRGRPSGDGRVVWPGRVTANLSVEYGDAVKQRTDGRLASGGQASPMSSLTAIAMPPLYQVKVIAQS